MVQYTVQFLGQLLGGIVSFGRVLVQTFENNGFQVTRNGRVQLADRYRFIVKDLEDGVDNVGGLKRWSTSEQKIENGAKGVNVRGGADSVIFSGGLFGCHIAGGTQHAACCCVVFLAVNMLGEAKVRDLQLTLVGQH